MMDVGGMDYCYEDMFKEITRKLYGNVEAGIMQQNNNGQSVIAGVFNGVINEAIVVNGKMADFGDTFKQHPSPTQVVQEGAGGVIVEAATAAYLQEQFQAETAAAAAVLVGAAAAAEAEAAGQAAVEAAGEAEAEAAASAALEEEVAEAEGEVDPNAPDTWYMTDETLEWTDSKIASYNPKQKLFRCIDCECCGFLARVAEHWLGTHANLRVFQCPHCPYASAWARCVRMHLARQHNAAEHNSLWTENPVLGEVTKYLSRLRARVEAGPLVVVAEDEVVDQQQQQLELEQHEQQLHEQQLREHQLHEQQLHEQQLREQQLHEQRLQQQLQQQAVAAAAAAAAAEGRSPSQEDYAAALSAAESVITTNAMTQTNLPGDTLVARPTAAAAPARPSTSRSQGGGHGGKGPRRVNKAIAVAAAVAAARGGDVDAAAAGAAAKRYNCSSCPYQTDRRDLYTRHEAIHLAEKPFHCYACQKQFNRADHVKKHFLRMHRDQPYDLNRIRRNAHHAKSGGGEATRAARGAGRARSATTSATAAATPTGNGTMAFFTKLPDPEDVNGNGVASTSSQSLSDEQELQLQQQQLEQQQLELEQQQLEQQQLQQHELQLQQQEIQLQQQQIILQTQPLAATQASPAATINIPNMANYSSALSSRLPASNGHKAPQEASSPTPKAQVDDAVPRTKAGREKRYPCPYCTWSGVDNWCLKRHLNTHLKPYVCALCDYKAARSERLQTHVLKVHNKRSCIRCSYMADDQTQLNAHLQEHHGQLPSDLVPPPPRQKRAGRKPGGGGAWGHPLPGTLPAPMYQAAAPGLHEVMNHVRRPAKRWRPRPQGAERLFNYMEASDSEDEMLGEDLVCQQCGLEFLDSVSLQTHLMSMHRMTLAVQQGAEAAHAAQAAGRPYHCTICGYSSPSHPDIVKHMQKHAVVELRCLEPGCRYTSSVPGAMEEHSRLAHPSMPPLNQKCPHCGFVVLSVLALNRHAKTHHLATVECAACTRVHQRFERHGSGEMWSEEDQEDDEELMAAAAQAAEAAVNAIEDDGDDDDVEDGEDGGVAVEGVVGVGVVGDKTGSSKACSDHEVALRVLRRQWNSRRRRVFRYRVKRRELQSLIDSYPSPDSAVVKATPAQLLRIKHIGRWLVRRRLACYICPPGRRLTWPVHTPATLAAHFQWRHHESPFPCDTCGARFRHRYQALLHASREHLPETLQEALPEGLPEGEGSTAIAEPIVTLTVPQYLATTATTTTAVPGSILGDIQQHQLLDPQFSQQQLQVQQVYHAQVQPADASVVHPQETYTIDDTRITVVPVLYTCAPEQAGQEPQQPQLAQQAQLAQPQSTEQPQQFEAPMYNGMMVPTVPKQVWYPQLTPPSYYISTQFPST